MAIIYDATLKPNKLELLAVWLPAQSWFPAGQAAIDLERLGAYRFEDPAGEVGIETHVLRTGGDVVQVPLTYRPAPLPGAEQWLAGTMQHSVLGERWVYDACADPVYAAALAAVILQGDREADQFREVDGRLEPLPGSLAVRGSGSGDTPVPTITTAVPATEGTVTTGSTGQFDVAIQRVLGGDDREASANTLTGSWNGQPPVLLAWAE